MELELRDFLRLARRWWWLLLLAPIVAATTARTIETRQKAAASEEYEATASILVNPIQRTGESLYGVYAYGELLQSTRVLEPVIASLRLTDRVEDLRERLMVAPLVDPDGRAMEIIEISVRDTDPQRAADTATAIVHSFVSFIGENTVELSLPSRQALEQQIRDVEQEIADTGQQINQIEQAGNVADPAVQARLENSRGTLNRQRDLLQELTLAAQEMDRSGAEVLNQVSVSEEALVPVDPIPTSQLPIVSLSAVASVIAAVAVVLFLAYLDTTVKPSLDFSTLTGSPLLSVLPRVSRLRAGEHQLFVVERPKAEASEAIRLLRTNIEFASDQSPVKSLAITSPGAGEGKSTLTANLAVAMAQAGVSVVVIDADLRKPSQHIIFGTSSERGLTNLLAHADLPWTSVAVATSTPNLVLIPSGPAWPIPADLLSRDRLPQLLADISQSVDVILIDTPPILTASDALAVADHADGVLLACRSGRTRIHALRNAAGALHRGSIRIVGVVLTWQSHQDDGFHPHPVPPGSPREASRRSTDRRRDDRLGDPKQLTPATSGD